MGHCPTPESLECLLREEISDAERERIEAHVEDCAACQETLHDLALTTEGPAPPDLLAALSEAPPAEAIAEAEVFLDRLKQKALTPFPGGPQGPVSGLSESGELPDVAGYEILGELGRGAVGIVYRARHRALNRLVALKMILAGPHLVPEARQRFRVEARAIARLRHPNIVQVYEVGEHAGCPYLALELVEGENLAAWVAGVPHPAAGAARIVATLAEAVEYAHGQGVIHRDLKPANVLLAADGTPRITDFGLAKVAPGPGMDEDRMTQSGMILGTPSYIAPEQARGHAREAGPAADIYSLGAMLYELLTGRPPFHGASPMDTLLQAAHQEPVPATRLVAHLPRDLDTICLKCLEKDPTKRYATAGALAADLGRFLNGEPITARPVGAIERGLRWLRRRPALGTALAGGVLFALSLTVFGLRSHWQRSEEVRAAVAAAAEELHEAAGMQRRYDFAGAAAVLRRARLRLGDDGPAELRRRLARASQDLDVVRRLDSIRLRRSLVLTVVRRPILARRPGDGPPPAVEYEATFRDARLGTVRDDPASVAARVAASPVHTELIAALDDWAGCAADRDQRAWILAVARMADPDPWRDRIRNPETWDHPAAIAALTAAVPVAEQPPRFLATLARRLWESGHDDPAFIRSVVLAHPGDFWANVELAYLSYARSPLEGLGYYRTALAIRPETPAVHGGIGVLYLRYDQMSEARHHFQEAADRAPSEPWTLNNLGMIALAEGHREEAASHFRTALRLDPDDALAHGNLALVLEADGRRAEALEECRKALRLDPKDFAVKPELQGLLLRLGRGDEWRRAWQQELAGDPPDHDAWLGYAELCVFLRQEAEYRRIRRNMLRVFGSTTNSYVAIRIGRACLLLPGSDDESRQAVALIDRGVAKASRSTWIFHHFLFSKAMAEYRLGRFDEAIALLEGEAASASSCTRLLVAMAQHRSGQTDRARKTLAAAVLAFDCSPAKADNTDAWYFHIFRREAESLILPQRPAFLEGRYQPRDNDERLALAGGCRFRDLRRAEASLYAAAFAADPKLAERLATGLRYRAARAAAVAGCGGGADGAGLGEPERARWRRQARSWLRADVDAWANELATSPGADRGKVARTLASWRADPDLAGLRDPRALDALPEAERRECLAIWGDLTARVGRFGPHRGAYLPLLLEKVATTVTTRGMFYTEESQNHRLIFDDWSPKEFEGVPFHLIDPVGQKHPNAILLHGPRGKFAPRMPKSVRVPCHTAARAIHFLGGVSSWGYPTTPPGSVSMIVRLHYQGGPTEDHTLKNGEHLADYFFRVDVPGSKFAFRLGSHQLRYLAVFPRRDDEIEEIELIKGPDETAPIVMAVTVETR